MRLHGQGRKRPSAWLLWGAAGAVALGVAIVLAAPVLPGWMSAFVYACASLVCHQRPERSFHWGSAQFAVCARCTGIYVGAAIAGLLSAATGPSRVLRLERVVGACVLLASAPVVVSVLTEWTGTWTPSDMERALTGVVFGSGAMAAVAVSLVLAASDAPGPHTIVPSPPTRPDP